MGPQISTLILVRGDAYYLADNRAIAFATDGTWPALSGSAALVCTEPNTDSAYFSVGGSTAAGSVSFELSATNTALLPFIGGREVIARFAVVATLADGHAVTLVRGPLVVLPDQGTVQPASTNITRIPIGELLAAGPSSGIVDSFLAVNDVSTLNGFQTITNKTIFSATLTGTSLFLRSDAGAVMTVGTPSGIHLGMYLDGAQNFARMRISDAADTLMFSITAHNSYDSGGARIQAEDLSINENHAPIRMLGNTYLHGSPIYMGDGSGAGGGEIHLEGGNIVADSFRLFDDQNGAFRVNRISDDVTVFAVDSQGTLYCGPNGVKVDGNTAFTGTGSYSNFTIVGGIITSAS